MTSAIAYRGPDGDGHWIDSESGIALGHRRLAIIDLSPTGFQPMASADGRIVISYNGELYNAAEMAAELAMNFRGTSDTEILVEAIARFGIDGALKRANGLFAFAAYHRPSRVLHLARDRLGIKPLYWTRQSGTFAFASELKALRALYGLTFTIEPNSVAAYLRHSCIPAPQTIYRDVCKLSPGHRLEISASELRCHCYWDLGSIAREGQADPDGRPDHEIVEDLDALLFDAVKRQMISDVPIGAFLSGGIDSSTVVAMMQRASSRPVRTYSIGFREKSFNEAENAGAVARHLRTEHTELMLTAADAQAVIPDLPTIYDEPFADSSQIPTFLVSRLARSSVTVALSGDGGDECFAGYVRHQAIGRMWGAVRHVPLTLRRMAANALDLLSPATWESLAAVMPQRFRPAHFGEKIVKGVDILPASGTLDMYRRLISQWSDPRSVVSGASEYDGWLRAACEVSELDTSGQMRFLDMKGYLPDDVLTKVDRASMAVSLEVRVPLLDHRVVEFSWRLPTERLIVKGVGKRPLRAVLDRYVPRHLVDRPKMGFGIPIGDWLKGPLRPWAEELLSPSALSGGFLNEQLVRRRFEEHLSGRRNWSHALWAVLQFQAWQRAWH